MQMIKNVRVGTNERGWQLNKMEIRVGEKKIKIK